MAHYLRAENPVRDVDPRPVLVLSYETGDTASLVGDLRGLGRVAVSIDAYDTALEMMQVVEFAVVIVNIDDAADWHTCERIAATAACPVSVVTRFLARDRRYRVRAFGAGVAAYVCRPCSKACLREMLIRAKSGEIGIELVRGAGYCLMEPDGRLAEG